MGRNEIGNDLGPEASESFVVASVCGVLAADGQVVRRDTCAHAAQSFGWSMLDRVVRTDADVGAVSPLLFGECVRFPLSDEIAKSGFAGKERVGGIHL